jgi:hypothetical protein
MRLSRTRARTSNSRANALAQDWLYDSDDSARDRVAAAVRELERASRVDVSLAGSVARLRELAVAIEDATQEASCAPSSGS